MAGGDGRAGGKAVCKVGGEPKGVAGRAEDGVEAVGSGVGERGAQATERAEAGGGQVGDAGSAGPGAAADYKFVGLGG